MADMIHVHAETPQPRRITQIAEALRAGKVIAYPTDSSYGLACAMGDKDAIERICAMRGLGHDHFFTLVCRDLSEISTYARVENTSFRLLKAATPGAYTFVLPATKEVPAWLAHPKRKTIGIRVPGHPVARAIAEALDALGASSMAPAAGPDSRALIQVEDGQGTGRALQEIRLIMLDSDRNFLLQTLNLMRHHSSSSESQVWLQEFCY